ncbi:MAG: HEAT repeat domain-containing protein [Phycisphaerales bacterium]|jgi:HEAT repeat protein|nr:HEAT repeat domain-containing protein [Phycisphaerales bacterium]
MKLKLLVGIAVILSVLVIWNLVRVEPPQLDDIDARMEQLRADGDTEALSAEIRNPDIRTARRAVKTMGYLGPLGVMSIRDAMKDTRPQIRQEAVLAYARAADPKEAEPMAELARTDKAPVVRAAAVTGLGRTRAYEKMDTLLAAMNDDDVTVRQRAADAVVLLIGRRYPYEPNASPSQRLKYIAVIRQFWSRAKGTAGDYYDRERVRRKDLEHPW